MTAPNTYPPCRWRQEWQENGTVKDDRAVPRLKYAKSDYGECEDERARSFDTPYCPMIGRMNSLEA